jgi:hypothetical protein
MRHRIALICAIVAGAVAPLATSAEPVYAIAEPTAVAKTCGTGYVHAYLSWGEKCLRAGQFCKVGNREYRKYGFYCPPSGHLRRR